MTTADDLLDAAVDLIPEAWHLDIESDAQSQGCTVRYVAGPDGPDAATIKRVLRHFADHDEDDDWWSLSEGQRLDEAFPEYGGIGSWELLDALGVAAEYRRLSDP